MLARHLNHVLAAGGQGADAIDPLTGRRFEYKVSAGSGFNFHFGARKSATENESLLRRKFAEISGAYVGEHNHGSFLRIAYCPVDVLLNDILRSVAATSGGQLQKGYSFEQFLRIGETVLCSPVPDHQYAAASDCFREVYRQAEAVGLRSSTFSKGGQGEVVLAHKLGHTLSGVGAGAGADAVDQEGGRHEYKISVTNQFNFHLGARKETSLNTSLIQRKFAELNGVWVAVRQGMEIVDYAHCSGRAMADYLTAHFSRTTGGQLNKNFSLAEFRSAFSSRTAI
jgi:hypothetical protein